MHVILINLAALVSGTLLGCGLKSLIPVRLRQDSMVYFAVITVALGVRLLEQTVNFSAVVIAFLLGGTVGHFLHLDAAISRLPKRFASQGGAVDASVFLSGLTIFCISASGITGSVILGFSGDATLLTTKAVMDFVAAIFFAAAGAGMAQMLIAIPLGIMLFGLYAVSGLVMPLLSDSMIGDFSSCGGMILILNSLRMAKLKDPPVADFIPALVLVLPISWLWGAYGP